MTTIDARATLTGLQPVKPKDLTSHRALIDTVRAPVADPVRSQAMTRLLPWAVPAVITVAWLVYVTVSGHWDRIAERWQAALTMTGGSFVAGSTPQGGGSVAFPVFTKAMEIPTPVARTFSLSIQAFGMTTASLVILAMRRRVDMKAVLFGASAGILGFLGALFVIGDSGTTFWEPAIPASFVKVTFTVIVAAMAFSIYEAARRDHRTTDRIARWDAKTLLILFGAGSAGGVASALTGSGSDVALFLFLVIVGSLSAKVGVPTSVMTMAIVSVVGIVVLGIMHGQLSTEVVDGQVVAVGGESVAALPAARYDLFGLWIAAVPVVVWGAPLGTVFAGYLSERRLVGFVTLIATVEVVTTAIFLDDLHRNPVLAAYGIGALVLALAAVRLGMRSKSSPTRSVKPIAVGANGDEIRDLRSA